MARFAELTSAKTNETIYLQLAKAFLMEVTADGTRIMFEDGTTVIVTQDPNEIFSMFMRTI